MKLKPIPIKISIAIRNSSLWGNQIIPFNDVPGYIDFKTGNIHFTVETDLGHMIAACVGFFYFQITALQIQYCKKIYQVDLSKLEYELLERWPIQDQPDTHPEKGKIRFGFSLTKSRLFLTPVPFDGLYKLVFSGAREDEFHAEIMYKDQKIQLTSPKDHYTLTATSEQPLGDEVRDLIFYAFSLFQNAEIKQLECLSSDTFMLSIQEPHASGTQLCKDVDYFKKLWVWLATNADAKKMRNAISFFLAGSRNRGEYLDFRLLNLFVCMDSICDRGNFGKNISKQFGVTESDGCWLAKVRNHMVHEGATIQNAIVGAFDDLSNQKLTFSRYTNFQNISKSKELSFTLYCDVIDLIMAYFCKQVGYDKDISKMTSKYHVTL